MSWGEGKANGGMGEGKILDLASDFYVAKEKKDDAKSIVNGQGHAIKTGKGSGGGYAIQRVYRYSNGKADIAPNYYHR